MSSLQWGMAAGGLSFGVHGKIKVSKTYFSPQGIFLKTGPSQPNTSVPNVKESNFLHDLIDTNINMQSTDLLHKGWQMTERDRVTQSLDS